MVPMDVCRTGTVSSRWSARFGILIPSLLFRPFSGRRYLRLITSIVGLRGDSVMVLILSKRDRDVFKFSSFMSDDELYHPNWILKKYSAVFNLMSWTAWKCLQQIHLKRQQLNMQETVKTMPDFFFLEVKHWLLWQNHKQNLLSYKNAKINNNPGYFSLLPGRDESTWAVVTMPNMQYKWKNHYKRSCYTLPLSLEN